MVILKCNSSRKPILSQSLWGPEIPFENNSQGIVLVVFLPGVQLLVFFLVAQCSGTRGIVAVTFHLSRENSPPIFTSVARRPCNPEKLVETESDRVMLHLSA